MKFTSIVSALFAAAVASAAPVAHKARDVWDPKMTSPNADTVWYSGQTQTVTWETTDQPKEITDVTGFITINFNGIETPIVLAQGFDLRSGQVDVIVPEVFTGSDFSLTLFGDSGNVGPAFTINGIDV